MYVYIHIWIRLMFTAHVGMIMLMDIYTNGHVYITGHEHSYVALKNMSAGPFLCPCDTCASDYDHAYTWISSWVITCSSNICMVKHVYNYMCGLDCTYAYVYVHVWA